MLKMIFFVFLGLLVISWIGSLGTQAYKYGLESFSPRVDLKTATREIIEPLLIPGKTTRQELFVLFGAPDSEGPKVVYIGNIAGNKLAERRARHRVIRWSKWVGH